jgi:pimeloyl-ACP methyl ester carboxylesterase
VRKLLTVVAIVLSLWVWLGRVRPLRRLPAVRPVTCYADAVERLAPLQQKDDATVNPLCRTHLLTHGQAVEHVTVLLHGFTNCPHQFHQLAAQLHEQGDNVLNVRLPRHGLADPLTGELALLRAEELAAQANEVIDIAHGLGRRVTLLGFSLGGVVAAWAASERSDLDYAFLVSPAIGIGVLSTWRSRLYANLLVLLPNWYRWWDPVRKAERDGPRHAYPRFATRGLAALLRLGCIVQYEARRRPPVAGKTVVITNPCDTVVANDVVAATVSSWRTHGATIPTYEFPADWRLIHDLMDPTQTQQQVARVYPQLLNWINAERRA